MEQLGASFTNLFLLPYLKTQILGTIDNDTRLQNMFRYDKVLRPEELQDLIDDSFQDTGTILQDDVELRTAFWKEFYDFVQRQKNLCNGNILKLAFRMLPDAKSGSFSREAEENLLKFTFYAVSKLEDTLIQREINQREVLGKISAAQAADDKADMKKGKMILVKGKDGKYNYMSDKDIARAIGNVERTAKMLANLQTEKTPEGETKVFTFNPSEISEGGKEVSSSPQEVQELLWKKQSLEAEKQLEENGIYVEGHITVDTNGIAHGFVQDKNNIRLRVEFDVKKPGERVFRMTFVNNPDNKFFVAGNELKSRFGEKKQSALEVFRDKEEAAGRVQGVAKMRGSKIGDGGAPVRLPENRKITTVTNLNNKVQPSQENYTGGTSYFPVETSNRNVKSNDLNESKVKQNSVQKGALEAKKELEAKFKKQNEKSNFRINTPTGSKGEKNPNKARAKSRSKGKSLVLKVAKYYAAGIGGAIGTAGIYSLFT